MGIHRLQTGGFTLVELLIAIMAFGFVASGLSVMFGSIQNIQQRAVYLESANQAARSEVESLRNNNYAQLTDGQTITFTNSLPSNLPKPRSGTAVISEPTPGIKRVNVTVTYSDKGTPKKVTLSSFIGVIGISQ